MICGKNICGLAATTSALHVECRRRNPGQVHFPTRAAPREHPTVGSRQMRHNAMKKRKQLTSLSSAVRAIVFMAHRSGPAPAGSSPALEIVVQSFGKRQPQMARARRGRRADAAVAERSNAVAQGTIPKERAPEPRRCQFFHFCKCCSPSRCRKRCEEGAHKT